MDKIILFTIKNCPRCPEAKKLMGKVCSKLGLKFVVMDISEEDSMSVALECQIASAPAIAVDSMPLFIGDMPDEEELATVLKESI